jgi:tRNA pseudouridine55 synthase
MNGVLVIDKPAGPTSHDVVARVRRVLGARRIGHTGTLDPLATGVLPLVVGRATRLAALLGGTDKEYLADVRFGAATPTYDADSLRMADPETGLPLMPAPPEPPGLTREAIERALPEFVGNGWQVPPPFSAKKVDGVRAYTRARRNQPVALRPVRVTVHRAALEVYAAGVARIRLACSGGYYVRSFAHDLGGRLGCGAYLERLQRTRAGDFTLEEAVPLERLEQEGPAGALRLIPLERLLPGLPGIVLNEQGVRRASHGNTVSFEDITSAPAGLGSRQGGALAAAEQPLRLLDAAGMLLGIAQVEAGGLLHPVIVLV